MTVELLCETCHILADTLRQGTRTVAVLHPVQIGLIAFVVFALTMFLLWQLSGYVGGRPGAPDPSYKIPAPKRAPERGYHMKQRVCHVKILNYYVYECELRGIEPTYTGFDNLKQMHRESNIIRCLVAHHAARREPGT
ncbi:MAG: hypothetical protein FWG38_01635 [Defluviitaleaceae bacterium]|nr:hypothetical protein [Defluviitaleaceae bacterium]